MYVCVCHSAESLNVKSGVTHLTQKKIKCYHDRLVMLHRLTIQLTNEVNNRMARIFVGRLQSL